MDNEKYKAERNLVIVDIKLEKEKTKKWVIMILLYSILSGIGMYAISGGFNTLKDFLCFIIMSIIFGSILVFITMVIDYVVVFFTDINSLEDRKKHLKDIIGNQNTTRFDRNKIKKYAKSHLTDKDYETILMCIDFSIFLTENEIEGNDDKLIVKEKSEEFKKLNQIREVFIKQSKLTPFQINSALNCVYDYFDTMIDLQQFDRNVSDEYKENLFQRIETLNSVIFKLELQQ